MAAMFVKAMGQRAAQIAITLLRQVANMTIASFVVVPHFTTLATQMGFLGIQPSIAILPPQGYLFFKRHIVKLPTSLFILLILTTPSPRRMSSFLGTDSIGSILLWTLRAF